MCNMNRKKPKSLVIALILATIVGPFAFGYVRSSLGFLFMCASWGMTGFAFLEPSTQPQTHYMVLRLATLFFLTSIIVSVWSVYQGNQAIKATKKPWQ